MMRMYRLKICQDGTGNIERRTWYLCLFHNRFRTWGTMELRPDKAVVCMLVRFRVLHLVQIEMLS